jgi:choline dehydrogenase-like flavoprotein
MSQPVELGVSDEYEIIVVGSGEGGKYLAWTMAKQGKRVLVIERNTSAAHVRILPTQQEHHS